MAGFKLTWNNPDPSRPSAMAPAQRFCLPRPWLLALLALTALRYLVAAVAPLAPDEAYYWLWSEVPQASYYDHPAMVALFIRAGTMIAGPTPLGIRLLGPAAIAAITLLLADAAQKLLRPVLG